MDGEASFYVFTFFERQFANGSILAKWQYSEFWKIKKMFLLKMASNFFLIGASLIPRCHYVDILQSDHGLLFSLEAVSAAEVKEQAGNDQVGTTRKA